MLLRRSTWVRAWGVSGVVFVFCFSVFLEFMRAPVKRAYTQASLAVPRRFSMTQVSRNIFLQNSTALWRLFFSASRVTPEASTVTFDEDSFRRLCAYGLCFLMLTLLFVSITLNMIEGNWFILPPLCVAILSPIFCLLWLMDKSRPVMVALACEVITLNLLAAYILLVGMVPDGSSLLWITLYPPVVILGTGLRCGSIAFAIFYVLLLLLFLTPLEAFLSVPVSTGIRTRLLLTLLGSYAFVACIEYVRHRTNVALQCAVLRLEQTSLTDSLTGLGNRRDFDKFLAWSMAKTRRKDETFALALMDIDHFKKVNDTYGHEIGDQVLQHIANHVCTQIRTADRLFRWGGEEFSLIMPNTNLDDAMAGAERIRSHIEKTPFVLGQEKIYITISIGVYAGSENSDPKKPLTVADQCLYRAKSTGRNKIFGGS